VPVALTVAGSRLNICQGESVTITAGSSVPGVSYQWVTGDTTASITVTQSGTYTVDVTNQCGSGTSLPVNITVFNTPADPVVQNDTIQTPGTAVLSATGNGALSWYDVPSGGTVLGTGGSFTTPFINNTTTFYVEDLVTHPGLQFNLGPADNTVLGGGTSSNSNQALIFDCHNAFILHSVKVYAASAGTRTILLEDANGVTLQSAVVNVVAGANTVVLDFNVSPGTGYQLTRTGGELFRNNAVTAGQYPFSVSNYCTITGSTAGAQYYYFFYDWDIRLPDAVCSSSRVPVTAVIESPNTIAEVAELRSLSVFPNPASGNVTVRFELNGIQSAAIGLIDAIGNVALSRVVTSSDSRFEETLDVTSLAKGVYSVHILSNNKNYYHKLVIQ
jgi:hypothetical protein